jgi:hypothetical protein
MRLQVAAFRLDGRPISVAEVLAGSVLGGFGAALLRRTSDDLAAVPAAEAKGLETTGSDIQRALDRWRTERDLIAADEFRAWLAAEGLDLDQMVAWLDRELLRQRLESGSRAALDAHQPDLARVIEALPESALFSAEIPALAEQLALRLVAPEPAEDASEALAAARAGLLGGLGCDSPADGARLCAPLGVDEASVGALIDAELAYRLLRSEMGRDELLQEELREHQEDLVRFEIAEASFANEDIAREVVCCVREDGDTIRRSSSRAGEPCTSRSALGSELAGRRFGNRLLAARAKDVFGPVEAESRHHVAQLVRKVEPDLRSDHVREELTDRIVDRALRKDLMDRVVFAVGDAA